MPSSLGRVLVTGGCGFIGSFTVVALANAGYEVVVLDEAPEAAESPSLGDVRRVRMSMTDVEAIADLLVQAGIRTVVHLAGMHSSRESLIDPLHYYRTNSASTNRLIRACRAANVKELVFASSALVYGAAAKAGPLREDIVCQPQLPYARSKMISEWVLDDIHDAWGLRSCILRYFNVAGASVSGRMGRGSRSTPHLVDVLCRSARSHTEIALWGHELGTHDGTTIRDYVHVIDIARANLLAVQYLQSGGEFETFNVGTGVGTSTLEMIRIVEEIVGQTFAIRPTAPTAKTPMSLVADITKIRACLGWEPRFGPREIVEHSWRWELFRHPSRPEQELDFGL